MKYVADQLNLRAGLKQFLCKDFQLCAAEHQVFLQSRTYFTKGYFTISDDLDRRLDNLNLASGQLDFICFVF